MKVIKVTPDWKKAESIQKALEDGLDAQSEIRRATGLDLPDDFTVEQPAVAATARRIAHCKTMAERNDALIDFIKRFIAWTDWKAGDPGEYPDKWRDLRATAGNLLKEHRRATGADLPSPFCYHPDKCRGGRCVLKGKCND